MSYSQTHELAELFDLRSESLDEEPRRSYVPSYLTPSSYSLKLYSVVVHRQSTSGIPSPTLAEALLAKGKSSSQLTFGSLRKSTPSLPNNAIYLEGFLGYDESMLREILLPQMRGLKYSLDWIVRLPLSLFLPPSY